MATVFVVTAYLELHMGLMSSEFEDQRVLLYANRELAERVRAFFEARRWQAWVDEVEVQETEPLLDFPPEYALFHVSVYSDCKVHWCHAERERIPDEECEGMYFSHPQDGQASQLEISCWATSHRKAKAIAREKARHVIEKGWRSTEPCSADMNDRYLGNE